MAIYRHYHLAHCETDNDSDDLDTIVGEFLTEGWQLWGSPFYGDKGVYQALTMEFDTDGV